MYKIVRTKTKKKEFFQKILIVMVAVSVVFTAASYILSVFDKNPVENLSIEIIRTLWGTSGVGVGAYALQNCVRAFTGSKWGVPDSGDKESDTSGNS